MGIGSGKLLGFKISGENQLTVFFHPILPIIRHHCNIIDVDKRRNCINKLDFVRFVAPHLNVILDHWVWIIGAII
jgi:hypothetical protein